MQTRDNKDALGYALKAHLDGEPSFHILERIDGYLDVVNVSLYFAEFEEWAYQQRKAMDYVKGRVLDVGCGAGRHALYLKSKGFRVLGIDESPLAISVCRARGLRNVKVLGITQISSDLGSFDTILMLGGNLGLLGGFKRARWLLRKFARITSDDGQIIAESLNPYAARNHFHKQYQKFNRNRGRMPGQLRLRLRYAGYATPWFDYLFVSPTELKRIVENTGWQIAHFIHSDSPFYVAILEKST
ncbi:MAG: class I SAM-dependent methyltransferase [Planctomycetota bacterium]